MFSLYYAVISHFDFEDSILVQSVPSPGHCLCYTFIIRDNGTRNTMLSRHRTTKASVCEGY